MNFFEHRYYRLNKTMMKLLGQWPYRNSRLRCCFCAAIIYANTSETITLIVNIVKYRSNLRIFLDCAIPLLINLVCATNLICFMSNSKNTLCLLNRIRSDWQEWAQHQEIYILHEYTKQGQKINGLFTAMVYFAYATDRMQLGLSKIIDVLLKNGTEPGKFPYFVEYYNIDLQKYYFHILIYQTAIVAMIIGVVLTNNLMLLSYVQHACGLFATLGCKLTRIANNHTAIQTKESLYVPNKRVHLAWCIERHNDAIEYANLIERMYTWNTFFTIFFGMILTNVLGLQFLYSTMDPELAMELISSVFAILFLFWVDCYIAQILMDHSLNMHFHTYNNRWYRLSFRAQKVLQIMSLRCAVPCELTAGKILILSLRTFALTCRTALSYFALMRSTLGL